MKLFLFQMLWWLQPEATGTDGGPANGGGGGGAPPGCNAGMANIGLLVVMFLVFYFLLIRPQQKRQKQHEEMLKSLKRGDKVRTSSGVLGEIVEIGEHDVTLQVADRVKINILRSHIATREEKPSAGAGSDGGKE